MKCVQCGTELADDFSGPCPHCGAVILERTPRTLWRRYFRIVFWGTPLLSIATAFAEPLLRGWFSVRIAAYLPGGDVTEMMAIGIYLGGLLLSAYLLTKAESKRGFDASLAFGFFIAILLGQLGILSILLAVLSRFRH